MLTKPFSIAPFVTAMVVVVAASNFLVQFQFNHFGLGELLTWGAFTYPVAFLINDLTNRRLGSAAAARVVVFGFVLALVLSVWLATPRIALASGSAFLTAQLLDTAVFDKLRQRDWWQAPLVSTVMGSLLDTIMFFSLAFASTFSSLDMMFGSQDGSLPFPVPLFGTEIPLWLSLAFGDLCVKLAIGLAMLVPYGALMAYLKPVAEQRT